jgi:hypothetical protein
VTIAFESLCVTHSPTILTVFSYFLCLEALASGTSLTQADWGETAPPRASQFLETSKPQLA